MSELAKVIVDEILTTLNQRKGFDWWWDPLDEEIQQEIYNLMVSDVDRFIE